MASAIGGGRVDIATRRGWNFVAVVAGPLLSACGGWEGRPPLGSYNRAQYPQVDTTKGTGGDILILEEAAYVEQGFFYETVAPLMIVGNTTLIGISTLTSEINFYTRLMRMRDKSTGLPMFKCLSIQLACDKCKDEGKAAECIHLLHLVPRWQSSERHRRLKTVMQDRPDLIQSELSGLAFESLQTVFRRADIDTMLEQPCPEPVLNDMIYIVIDPAAGGPSSDYAILSLQRHKGLITVRHAAR